MALLQTVLSRLPELEWIGILLARLSVGALFVLSGSRKLFQPAGRLQMRQTLEEAGVPFAMQTAVAVSCVEFVCGGLLLLGALTRLASPLLCGVMVVALGSTRLKSIHASSAFDWLSKALYLPEVLYLVILIWLFFSGPGWLSLDQALLFPSTG